MTEDNIKQLKRRRGQMKAELTRFETFLQNSNINQNVGQMQVRLDTISNILSEFKRVQDELETLLIAQDQLLDDQIETEERTSFENKYFSSLAKAKNIIDEHTSLSRADPANPSANPAQVPSTSSNSHVTAKLPRLTLKEFYGHYSEWQSFRDTFQALVHTNTCLSNIEKFYYLQASLKGEASQVIASLAIADANYDIAWKLLESRYDNKKAIINAHVKEIFELPVINKESHMTLRKFSDSFQKNYRALKSLGEGVDTWDTLLLYLLISKLDFYSKREWENYTKDIASPKIENFTTFVNQRCQILEALSTKPAGSCETPSKKSVSRAFYTSSSKSPSCSFCHESHYIYFCQKFKDLSVASRYEEAKRMNLCTNCLRFGHKVPECRSSGCKACHKRHSSLLHQSDFKAERNNQTNVQINKPEVNKSEFSEQSHSSQSNHMVFSPVLSQTKTLANHIKKSYETSVILSTAVINVLNSNQQHLQCRVLLDSGSQSNFVTMELIHKLDLPVKRVNIPVQGVGQIKTRITHQTHIVISSIHSNYKSKLSFFVIDKITDVTPQKSFDMSALNVPEELTLADPDFNIASNIDMLIGASIFYDLLCVGQIKLGKGLPSLQKTLLGWVVGGNIPNLNNQPASNMVSENYCLFSNTELSNQIEKFWELEEIQPSVSSKLTMEEIECEQHFSENVSRDRSGRFIVKLPVKSNYNELGESEQSALKRLYTMERKFQKLTDLEGNYISFMSEYEQLTHMTEVSRESNSKTPIYYMPHHSVEKPDSITTRIRVVFDASSKTSSGISLNDVLKVGPTIQNDLFSILIRFRKHNVVLIGDLAKMYRQILVHPDQRDLQRIVWRESPSEEVKHFQLNTITYGTASASFLATRCLKQIALDNMNNFSVESNIILTDFYMDDLLTGAADRESLNKVRRTLTNLLAGYGFEIRKFQSNDKQLLDQLGSDCDSDYIITEDSSTKALGISWKPSLDCFEYKSNNVQPKIAIISKRSILSCISKIFDPLGLLGPITIRAKLIIQKLWQLQIGWDESLPSELHTQWLEFYKQLSQIKLIQIPRHVLVSQPVNIQIHAFCDASEKSFAGVIYLRSVDNDNNVQCHLLTAKARVAPLKSVSLPRLELCGAQLVSRLLHKCLNVMDLKLDNIYLWTDSTIVLSWLAKEPSSWKTFVSNRTSEIRQLTRVEDWHHISSENNPADIISRGANLNDLISSCLWWHGPSFLLHDFKNWPENSHISNFSSKSSTMPEYKETRKTFMCQVTNSLFESFSKFNKLVRVMAYCQRFIHNSKTTFDQRIVGNLTTNEMQSSVKILVKLAQSESFSEDLSLLQKTGNVCKSSRLKTLSPFLDSQGIIRVGGRLKHSNLEYGVKHPIVLSNKHPFTRLIISHEHERSLHSGVQSTLAHVRQTYWPLNGRSLVRSCVRGCLRCFKSNPPACSTKMGELPRSRVTLSRPFEMVAVDYAGPFDLKDGKLRNKKIIKGYICVFVCLATKAVHLELITDLSSDGFLSSLKRFVARRGLCSDIYSDNATNFVGAKNELKFVHESVNSDSFQGYLNSCQINWHFIPARSPHFGGLWEAAVKSCKHHLKRILAQTHLTYEEFYTLLTQVEAVLNSRPLCPISEDPNDLEILTPAHLLIGQSLTAVPERDLTNVKVNFTRRYTHLRQMQQHFWSRWTKEYLHNLQQRTKWQFSKHPEIQVGALVLLMEDNAPPLCWPLGRIVQVHPGSDNIVRVVSVKTKNSVLKRAINKVSLLPIEIY